MFSFFLEEKALPTKIEKHPELKQILTSLQKLRDKEKELKKAADKNGAGSSDYRKHLVISQLVTELNAKIDQFNSAPHSDSDDDAIELVKGLATTIKGIRTTYEPTLTVFRDNHRKVADDIVNYGTKGAALAVSTALSLPSLLTLGAIFYTAPCARDKIKRETGLDDVRTRSLIIMDEFYDILINIGHNLGLKIGWNSALPSAPQQIPEGFLCPINLTMMTNPVLCLLDNFSYEKEAIQQWLVKNRNSPLNRRQMDEKQSVEDVLVPNKSLQNVIEEFCQNNPSMVEQEYKSDYQKKRH